MSSCIEGRFCWQENFGGLLITLILYVANLIDAEIQNLAKFAYSRLVLFCGLEIDRPHNIWVLNAKHDIHLNCEFQVRKQGRPRLLGTRN